MPALGVAGFGESPIRCLSCSTCAVSCCTFLQTSHSALAFGLAAGVGVGAEVTRRGTGVGAGVGVAAEVI